MSTLIDTYREENSVWITEQHSLRKKENDITRFWLEPREGLLQSHRQLCLQMQDILSKAKYREEPAMQGELVFIRNREITNESSEKRKKLKYAKDKFEELLPSLLREHKDKYVAIVEDNVEIDSDRNTLLDRVVEKYGYVSMYFDKIVENRKVVKLSNRPKVLNK